MTMTTGSTNAFDIAADRYDADAAANPMMLWLRGESLRTLTRTFRVGDFVLEVGCGTGTEAVVLARRGVRVVATDASRGMIGVVEQKLRGDARLAEMITPRLLPAEQLNRLVEEYGAGSFSGAYSSMGALNCTANLGGVVESLAALVEPGGRLVISILGKYCLWETVWYMAAGKPGLAFRRWRGRAQGTALSGGPPLQVYYWPLAGVERTFAKHFRIDTRRALAWALPPTYAAGFVAGGPRLFSLLRRVEMRTGRLWPFYLLGDHVLIEMTRR